MKPIAVVHHQVNGKNRTSNCFTQTELDNLTEFLKDTNSVFITCMLSLNVDLPSTKPRMVREAI